MVHWHLSCALCWLLTGRLMPLCAWVAGEPDTAARRAFERLMERVFSEARHCGRVRDTWLIGTLLRG